MAITGLGLPSMFDTQDALSRRMEDDAQLAGRLPLGGGMMYASSMKGDLENRSLMGLASLMGGKGEPMMEKQKAIDSVMQKFGRQPETADDYRKVASMFNEIGQYEFGEKAMAMSASITAAQPQPDKPNASIESFNEAVKGGYTGSYFEWYQLSLKKGDKNISIGSIPQDHIITSDENGNIQMQVIPGSPTDIKAKKEQAGKDEGAEVRTTQKSIVVEDIDRLKTKITEAPWYNPVAGSILAKFFENPYIGAGKNRIDGLALATTIKSSIGFDRLQQMRDESPTGGALGQVSELELITLQATLGSLDLDQSEEQLLANLDRLGIVYAAMLQKIAETGDGTFEEKMGGSASTTAAGSGTTNSDPLEIR